MPEPETKFDGLLAAKLLNPLQRAIGAAIVRALEKRPECGALALVHVVEDALVEFMNANGAPRSALDQEGERVALDCLRGRAWTLYSRFLTEGLRPHEALHEALAQARIYTKADAEANAAREPHHA